MSPKSDLSTCIFGSAIMLNQLDAIQAEIPGVLEAKDLECIHRMRVASRRLRAAQVLFDTCLPKRRITPWENEIKKITRSLGSARDLDIQIETIRRFRLTVTDPRAQPGANRLILRLLQQRASVQKKVTKSVNNIKGSAIIRLVKTNLEQFPSANPNLGESAQDYSDSLRKMAVEAIIKRMDDLLTYDSITDQPEKKEELHAMRIAAKHLRYTLEIFAPLYAGNLKSWIKSIKQIQEELGNLHDCDVWIDFLPEFLQDEAELTRQYYGNLRGYSRMIPGIETFLANRQAARQRYFTAFHDIWMEMKAKNSLHRLRSKLLHSLPIPQVEQGETEEDLIEPMDDEESESKIVAASETEDVEKEEQL